MEERASVRSHDDSAPMTAAELGELLFRCGRSRRSFQRDGLEYTSRPYPSGGSLYELELYPVVGRVAGLDRGLYHYEPDEHRLRLVRGPGPHVDRLLRAATGAAQLPGPPQLLLVVSARFGRLMYSYEEIPYSLILKHVGVLYQSLYLVATAMRLAPCGLGAGDCAAFGEATGRDFVVESSVGEFLLGSRTRTDTTGELDGPAAAT
jgi:SagB-type dehydrogenase family enzyme